MTRTCNLCGVGGGVIGGGGAVGGGEIRLRYQYIPTIMQVCRHIRKANAVMSFELF